MSGRLEAKGRPQPSYVPHVAEQTRAPADFYGRGAGGPQTRAGAARQNQGVLWGMGRVVADPRVLRDSYLAVAKKAHYTDLHEQAMRAAVEVPIEDLRAGLVPAGYAIVRRNPAERVSFTAKTGAATADELDEALAAIGREGTELEDGFVARSLDDAATTNDGRTVLMAPEQYLRGLRGEFTRRGGLARALDKPTRAWRALVLNLRPAWLAANLVGNSLMYAVANFDRHGVRALAGGGDEFEQLFRKHFADQAEGTFIGTQRPAMGRRSTRWLRVFGIGLADVDRWYERVLRRAAVKAELRRSPELAARVRAMRHETRTWAKAAEMELAENPQLAERISAQVNSALGDFSHLSAFEANYLRVVFPFYAWYRAIVEVTLKLPLEHPVKASLLARLGQIGAEMNLDELGVDRDEVLPFVRALIPIGKERGGRVPVVNTGPANPFSTTVPVGELLGAVVHGQPGAAGQAFGGSVNPFVSGLIGAVTGRTLEGRNVKRGPGGLPGIFARNFVEGLPQFRLGQAAIGRLYQGTPSKPTLYARDRRSELLSYLGIPVKRVSTRRARSLAEEYGR